ncbi:MAG: hypothetical protein NTW20_14975 [Rhodobacterales bacterium]|nr:hypothetical protein [Rhodobacterales bacterium]
MKMIELAKGLPGVISFKEDDLIGYKLSGQSQNLRLRFCADTDFACKGDPEFCSYRVADIKRAMRTYVAK